jgi:microcystin degradation protein MlrC
MNLSIFKKWYHLLIVIVLFQACTHSEKPRLRVLIGGIQHESNTFCPILTSEEDFRVLRGEEIITGIDWLEEAGKLNIEIIPTIVAGASPSGMVKQEVYEKFRDEILEGARKAGPVDGVYLAMHGALHVEGYDDAQVDLITRLRDIVGDAIISGSFDLHGNISNSFARKLDIMTAMRTAPHVDGPETMERAWKLLTDALQEGYRPAVAHMNIPILIPGEKGITAVEPLKSLYGQLETISQEEGLLDASIFCGMPWTDVPRAGMSVQVIARDSSFLDLARAELLRLASEIWSERTQLDFDVPAMDIDAAIETALSRTDSTVFITDSGDNTTAGAAGDVTYVLERLLSHGVPDAVFGGVVDPEAVLACENAGIGAEVELIIGGKIDTIFGKPLKIKGEIKFITPEEQRDTNKRAAVVKVDNVLVVLLAERRSFTAPSDFADVGIDPLAHKIVVTKLGYLFAGLREIATYTIMALTPGFAYQVIEDLEYNHVRRPIYPLDPDMMWEPGLNN